MIYIQNIYQYTDLSYDYLSTIIGSDDRRIILDLIIGKKALDYFANHEGFIFLGMERLFSISDGKNLYTKYFDKI